MNEFNIHITVHRHFCFVVLIWYDTPKSNSPSWKHKGKPCTLCTSHMFCICSQICDTLMHMFHPTSLEDGWRHSVSELHLAAVSSFDVGECCHLRCRASLGPSNQLFTKEQFEVKKLQWFLPQKLAVTLILKP
ncbi:hypothetical protein XENOCAPTIV_025112 [Xenoophorus captivus]|uniref:Uncharacterized protein n=1 Tax=Xenoophorus captivus TaxID=1517983 RepID=A0ABV0SHY5_9TELE